MENPQTRPCLISQAMSTLERRALRPTRRSAVGFLLGLLLLPGGGGVLAQDLALNASTFSSASEGNSGHTDHTFQVTLTQSVAGDVGYMLCFSSASSGENYATRNDDFRLIKGGVAHNARATCHHSVIRAGQTNTATGDLIGIRVLGDTRVEPDEKVDVELKPLIYIGDGRHYGNNVPYDYTDRSQMKYGVSLTAANASQSFTIMNDDQPRVVTRPPPKPLYYHSIVVHSDSDSEDPGRRRISNTTKRQIRVQLFKNPNPNYDIPGGGPTFKICIRPDSGSTATRDHNGTWDAGEDYRLFVGGTIVNGQCRAGLQFGSNGFSSSRIEIDVRNDTDVEPDETVVFTVDFDSTEHKDSIQVHPGTYTIRNDDFHVRVADPEVTIDQTGGPVDEGELARFRVKVAQAPGTKRPPGTPGQHIKVAARVPWSDRVWTTTIITAVLSGSSEWFEVPTNGVTGDYQLCAWVLPGNGYTPGGTSGNAPTSGSSCPSGHTVLVHAAQGTTEVKSSGDGQDGNQSDDGNVEDDGDTDTDNAPKLADYSELKAKVRTWAGEQDASSDHAQRWNRVLAALGDQDAIEDGYSPMTAAEAQTHADKGWTRWDEVVAALTEVESRAAAEAQAEPEPEPPPPDPELSLSAGSAVDEGASASFTIHADAAPAADLTVSVSVAQSGDWLDSPGAGTRAVTLAAGATTASLNVATVNDNTDEPDGSVSVTIDSGAGYAVASSPNDTASVTVRDDDDPPPPPAIAQGACVSVAQWNTVKGYYQSNANRSPNYGANWYRVLIAYRQDRGDQALPAWVGQTAEPTAAYTVKEAEDGEEVWGGWTPVRIVLQCLEKTYGGVSTDSVIGGVPTVGQSGEVGNTNPGEARERDRWNPQTGPRGFEPDALTDFAAGSCVSPRLRSEAAARANETWRGASHVERWLRVGQTLSGGANDATVVTPAEAGFHAAAGQPGWLPVADALRCMEQQSLREALSR